MSADPFIHHPELARLITPPEQSAVRELTLEVLERMLIEKSLPTGWWYFDRDRYRIRELTLAGRRQGDLWVFAYGSLMWDPAIEFAEVRKASVCGYQRRFILKDVYGGRGTKASPGLMAALDEGESCEGLVFRIEKEKLDQETEILWRRECLLPAYRPQFVSVQTDQGPLEALAFIADHDADVIDAGLTRDEQLEYLANGKGILGSSADYLKNIVSQFELLGFEDLETSRLLMDLEQVLETRHQQWKESQ